MIIPTLYSNYQTSSVFVYTVDKLHSLCCEYSSDEVRLALTENSGTIYTEWVQNIVAVASFPGSSLRTQGRACSQALPMSKAARRGTWKQV